MWLADICVDKQLYVSPNKVAGVYRQSVSVPATSAIATES